MTVTEIGTIIGIIILGGMNGIERIQAHKKRKREKSFRAKYGIKGNPERCGEMFTKITEIEKDIRRILIDQGKAEERMKALEKRVDNIGSVFKLAGDPLE